MSEIAKIKNKIAELEDDLEVAKLLFAAENNQTRKVKLCDTVFRIRKDLTIQKCLLAALDPSQEV